MILSSLTLSLALVALGPPEQPRGSYETTLPAELEGIEIVDRRGAELPLDLELTDHTGRTVRLGSYFDGQRPVILVLAYYECPMLCTMVLNGVLDGIKAVEFKPGKDYRIVVVSFDPRDTVESAAAKRKTYVEAYGRDVGDRGWEFLVGDPETVKQLAQQVGFPYRWDEKGKQFAHAAGIFLVTGKGRLSNSLQGIEFKGRDLEFALMEASQGRLGSTWKKVLLACFHYDPSSRGYVLAAFQLFKYGGMLVLLVVATFLLYAWRIERKRRARPLTTEPVNVRT